MTTNANTPAAAAGTFQLGDITVNRMGYGAMRITGHGIWGPPKDPENALAVLRRAVELGVNLIDTADAYGPYINEEQIAEALYPYPEGLLIATKGGMTRSGPNQWRNDGRPEHLRQACEGSLRRLKVERIDLYQFHWPDPRVPFEDSVGELARLREEGKIRHVGLSNVSVEQLRTAQKIVPIVSVQNRYNISDRASEDVLQVCEQENIGFLPWAPLMGRNNRLESIARAHNATPNQVMLAWLLWRSPVILPIPGTSSIKHLEENVAAASLKISDSEFESLRG
ncbi:MAG TPA: aldo/keto reductase [Oceanobacillus sp.]|nr:aldo/keto reductase [Oceanobacillus sp.]